MNNLESHESHEPSDSSDQWSSLTEEPSFKEHIKNIDSDEEELDYVNLEEIDISTEKGKYDWLDALYHNAYLTEEQELKQAIAEENEDEIVKVRSDLEETKMAQKILLDQINPEENVFDAICKERDSAAEKFKNMGENATTKAKEHANLKFTTLDRMAQQLQRRIEEDSES